MTEEYISPWGVNAPFIYLATIMFLLGGLSLSFNPSYHPYLMSIGVYSLFFGMILRLFFPAKKYLVTQLLSLIFLAIPLSHYFQFLASLFLVITEVWALKDVKSYGSKFPINVLVLSSPFLSAIFWFFFFNYWSLIIPVLVYILGVNIGVFSATMRTKPFFNIYQLPVLILSLSVMFFKIMLPITLLYYFLYLILRSVKRINVNLTSLLVIIVSLTVTFSSLYFGEETHAFYLGVMFPFFFSCITYSTARYNHSKIGYVLPLLALAYFLRFINLHISSLFLLLPYVYFIYMIKDTLNITAIKMGISTKYLK